MTAKAAKFETYDSTALQLLASAFAFATALLTSLALNGNLLLRYP